MTKVSIYYDIDLLYSLPPLIRKQLGERIEREITIACKEYSPATFSGGVAVMPEGDNEN